MKNFITSDISKSKQIFLNVGAMMIQFLLSLSISFFLSPYIVKTLGAEANGFVSLANNFISYFSVIIVALNGMAARFIAVSFHQGNIKQANIYYSSLFWGDLILVVFFSVFSFFFIWNLENIINISPELIEDIKMLFALIFINYLMTVLFTIWSTATYITNKVFLDSMVAMFNVMARAVILVVSFTFFTPHTYYLGLALFVIGSVSIMCNFYFKRTLLPELKVKKDSFDIQALKTLVGSGCWNSVSRIGGLLETGCAMLITNILVNPFYMGVLAVARTMPSVIDGLNGNLSAVFLPSLVKDYATANKEAVMKNIIMSSKIISIICSVPLCFLIVFGEPFYNLWQPTLNSHEVYSLSVLICLSYVFVTGSQSLFNVFTAYNKVRQNSLSVIVMGVISITITVILLKTTDWGVYAVAGVSPVVNLGRYLLFVLPYSAKCMGLKWTSFYSIIRDSLITVVVLCIWGFTFRYFMEINGWGALIASGCIFVIGGYFLEIFLLLTKNEREVFLHLVFKKIGLKKKIC